MCRATPRSVPEIRLAAEMDPVVAIRVLLVTRAKNVKWGFTVPSAPYSALRQKHVTKMADAL